jgi:hypothetical protein
MRIAGYGRTVCPVRARGPCVMQVLLYSDESPVMGVERRGHVIRF